MTLLIATVTKEAAWLSQDTAMFAATAGMGENAPTVGLSADPEAASAATFIGDGQPPEIVHLGDTCKIIFVPHRGMLSGVTGTEIARVNWEIVLQRNWVAPDISELPSWAPAALADIREHHSPDGLMVVCIGWSAKLGRAMGFAFSSDDGFKPVELTEGHTMMPPANPSCREYDAIVSRWTWAARGIEVEKFHRTLAENQMDAFRRGLLAPGRGYGGQLITARVDNGGIAVSQPHFLSDFTKELIAHRLADAGYDIPADVRKPV